MKLPTLEEMNELHKKQAPSKEALDSVMTHCHIVRRIARQIAEDYREAAVDVALVEIGALLHDIGVYRLYKGNKIDESLGYITHGLRGYELLKEEGLDEAICRFALLHTGVGITAEDVQMQHLPLPIRDYVAETVEEKIVMYADKFHSKKNPPVFHRAETYKVYLQNNFGNGKVKRFEELVEEFGLPHLEPLASRYGQTIK